MSSIVFCLLLSCFTFHLGFVHPLQDVVLHQCLPLSSVCCFPDPGYVVLPSSAWSSSWSLPSPWLPLSAALSPPVVLHSCYMTSPFPLLFQCVFYDVNYLCSFPDFLASYLVALQPTFSSPLLFEQFSVCLSIVYWETMFGSHRSLLARHIGPLYISRVKKLSSR